MPTSHPLERLDFAQAEFVTDVRVSGRSGGDCRVRGLPPRVTEDVARAALFLASSASNWVTGTALTVDGGIMTGA